jgi:hypothetical protein
VKPYLTPDMSDPRTVARFDETRLTWIAVTSSDRAEIEAEKLADRALFAWVLLFASVIVIALFLIGDPAIQPIEAPTTTAYTHPAPVEVAP